MQARTFVGTMVATAGAAAVLGTLVPGVAYADAAGRVRNGWCVSTTVIREKPYQLVSGMSAPGAGCGARVKMTCYDPDGGSPTVVDSGTSENYYPENTQVVVGVAWPINYCIVRFEVKDLATAEIDYGQETYYPAS